MKKSLALFVALVCWLASCSSDPETSGPSATVGTGGGAASGGQAGAGGSTDACEACVQQDCADELDACLRHPACANWAQCIQPCDADADPAACLRACNDTYNGVAVLYEPVYQCACASCDAACPNHDACNQKCVDDLALPLLTTPPALLSETGGYDPTDPDLVPDYVTAFAPVYQLWSDGAVKQRGWYIPKCTQIDTSDMDHWQLPVGTRFWKRFDRDGVPIEVRFIHRYGPEKDDWLFAAYLIDLGQGDGVHVPQGVPNANGTGHDIPAEGDCLNCHGKLVERALGFSAIQLSHGSDGNSTQPTTMATLSESGKLSMPNANGYTIPGSSTASAALGYLHANCGNCHNDSFVSIVDLKLRVLVGHTTVDQTDAYQTAVSQPVTGPFASSSFCQTQLGSCFRIVPGNPDASELFYRMGQRGPGVQMPPLATEITDSAGLQIVSAWISSLP